MQSTEVTTAPGAFADVAALRACWHPVAFGRDLADRPVHADLLGEPLVLWRGPDGGPRANSDLWDRLSRRRRGAIRLFLCDAHRH